MKPFDSRFEEDGPFGDASLLPKDVLVQVEEVAAVRAAMLMLPDDRRQALVWKYVEGLPVDAIALRMKRTAKAVESLLSRSREQMRNLLRKYMTQSGGEPLAQGAIL